MPFFPVELIPSLKIDQALGVRLAIRYLPSGVVAAEDMLLGNADFAGVAFAVLPNFLAKNKPLKAIASLNGGRPPLAIVVRKSMANVIRRIPDLRGRTLGTQIGNATTKTYIQMLAEMWLAAYSVNSSEVRWAPTNQNLDGIRGAMGSDTVDAVCVEEPAASMLVRDGLGVRLASMSDAHTDRAVVGDRHFRAVIVTSAASLQRAPQRATAMVQMVRRALGWVQGATPEQIVAHLEIVDAAWRSNLVQVLGSLPRLYSPDGAFGSAEIASTREFLQAAGVRMPGDQDITQLIDDRQVRSP
jgi:ABC-type nitrate/sulfonate/bicarbonate transport system substrate-binding protein